MNLGKGRFVRSWIVVFLFLGAARHICGKIHAPPFNFYPSSSSFDNLFSRHARSRRFFSRFYPAHLDPPSSPLTFVLRTPYNFIVVPLLSLPDPSVPSSLAALPYFLSLRSKLLFPLIFF